LNAASRPAAECTPILTVPDKTPMRAVPAASPKDTVQSAVLGRLDRLEPAWRDILRRAAVIGPEFSLGILAQLVGSHVDLDETISVLEELGFITQIRDESQSVFAFKHVIIQNVAYETLLLKQRREKIALFHFIVHLYHNTSSELHASGRAPLRVLTAAITVSQPRESTFAFNSDRGDGSPL
jgi:hypothetical protein